MFTSKIKLFAALAAFACVMMVSAQYADAGEWGRGSQSPIQMEDEARNPGTFGSESGSNWVRSESAVRQVQPLPMGESSANAIPQRSGVHFDGSLPEEIRNHMLPENFNRNDRSLDNEEWVRENSVTR